MPFNYETETGDDDIPTLNDILAASFVNVRFFILSHIVLSLTMVDTAPFDQLLLHLTASCRSLWARVGHN